MQLKSIFVLLLNIFLITYYAFSQQILLTLDDAIEIALEKSYEMKSSKLDLVVAKEDLTAAKGRFKTNVHLNLDIPNWQENIERVSVPNELPVFNSSGQIKYEGSLNIIQPLPTNGKIELRSKVYHDDISNYNAKDKVYQKRKDVLSSTTLRFEQPIFAINNLKLGLKQANLSYELAAKRYTQKELNIIYQVTDVFLSFYQAIRQTQIATDNLNQQQKLHDLTQKKFSAGLIPEVEALTMEVDLADVKNRLVTVKTSMARKKRFFLQLIGLNFTDDINIKTTLEIKTIDVDVDKAIEHALKHRLEIQQNRIDIELAKINAKQVDANSQIKGNLWAFYDITGVSDPLMDYRTKPYDLWKSSIDDMERRPKNRGVGFSLSVPLWDSGLNKAEVASAMATLRDKEVFFTEQKKTIEREVRNAVGQLHESINKLKVLDRRIELAEKAFNITMRRFDNGDITSQDLALMRDRLTSAKTAHLQAYIQYKLSIADLKQKSLMDFEKNQSLIIEK